jgi:hypothetical protein
MAYSDFDLLRVEQDFSLTIQEVPVCLPEVPAVAPDSLLESLLNENLSLALAQGNEKARSEWIINPVLTAVRRLLKQQISVFSGKEFNIEPSQGLNGYVAFLITRSPRLLVVEAPVLTIVAAKPEDLNAGLGQCLAEMVAAQRYNERQGRAIETVYGCVTNGELWKFVTLQEAIATIGLRDYALPPVDTILGILVWICNNRNVDKG